MTKKVLSLDSLAFHSSIYVGSHNYLKLFRKDGYEVFSLSHYLNITRFIRRCAADRELIKGWQKGVRKSEEGIYFYSALCLIPYMKIPLLDNLPMARHCLRFCYPGLRRMLKEKDFLNVDIIFINNIRLISVLRFVKARKIILRISDRIEGFGNAPKTITRLQDEVIKGSDLVVVTSKNLLSEACAVNKNSIYLPNGVDKDFVAGGSEHYALPEEYARIKKPIIVYMGAVSDWFDYELFESGLKAHKDMSFVIIGPVEGVRYARNMGHIKRFRESYDNFYYLGMKTHSELKKYLAHASAGIIPFILNSLTNEINPVKLFEYAAFGLPVLASNMVELKNYAEYVLFYKDKKEYSEKLSFCIKQKESGKEKMMLFARDNTWEKRFVKMQSEI